MDEPPGSASDGRVASVEFRFGAKTQRTPPPQPSPVPSAVGALAPTRQEAPQLLGGLCPALAVSPDAPSGDNHQLHLLLLPPSCDPGSAQDAFLAWMLEESGGQKV